MLPSFLLLLLIAAVLRNLAKYRGVEAFLRRAAVRRGAHSATAVTMGLTRLLGFTHLGDVPAPDIRSLLVLAVLAAVHFLWKRLRGKSALPHCHDRPVRRPRYPALEHLGSLRL